MYKRVPTYLVDVVKVLSIAIFSLVVLTLRYFLRTPQRLENVLPGEDGLYKSTHGYIAYKMLGSPTSPPLLLVHTPAIAASAYDMRSIMEGLAVYYHVYALDLLGFGRSDQPNITYSADIYVTLCQNFLKEVLAGPATLVASGLSCSYCIEVAARTPALCERLVLLSPNFLCKEQGNPQKSVLSYVAQSPLLGISLYSFLTTRVILRRVLAWQQGSAEQQISSTDLDYHFAIAHQIGAYRAPLALLAGNLDLNVTRQIAGIQQPILLLCGIKALRTHGSFAHEHSISTQSQVVLIRDAGISVQEEQPQAVIESVLEWQKNTSKEQRATPRETIEPEESTANTQPAEETAVAEPDTPAMQAYCMKCKQKRPLQEPKEVVTKNGRHALEGVCPVCGTRLFRFITR